MKIIYALHRDRNGGKYVHYNEDFCKKSSGGSHEIRYILRIFSKAGLSKDLYSKVYKTCRLRISEGNTRSAVLCRSGVTFVDKMDEFFSESSICRHNVWSKLRIFCKAMNFEFMQLFPCFCDNTFIVLAFKIALILTIYGQVGEIWFLLLAVTLRHFIRLRWRFHYTYSFCVAKMSVMFWTLLCKFLMLLLKIGVILSRNIKNTFTMVKI